MSFISGAQPRQSGILCTPSSSPDRRHRFPLAIRSPLRLPRRALSARPDSERRGRGGGEDTLEARGGEREGEREVAVRFS